MVPSTPCRLRSKSLRDSALSMFSQYVIFPIFWYTRTSPRSFEGFVTAHANGKRSLDLTGYGKLRVRGIGDDEVREQSHIRTASLVTAIARWEKGLSRKKARNSPRTYLVDVSDRK